MRHRGVGPARRRYRLHLEAKNYRDLTSIEPLIEDIPAGQGVELKPEFREDLRHRAGSWPHSTTR